MPAVSVIIPAYNQGHYLSQAIQSVLDQTCQDFEIIVVDDGSTDHTRQVAQSFTDLRVRYVYKTNGGLSSARNAGIRHAAGRFLTYLDSDDLFLPEKLSLLLAALQERPEWGLVAGQAVLIDENGDRLGEIFDTPLPEDTTQLLLGNPLHVGSVMVRREWQERVGFFDETLRSYEDWDMWLRLARAGCQMGWMPKPVSLYRFHRAQMTRNGEQMTAATFAVLNKTFSDMELLPEAWKAMRDEAYSRAYLRAAAQAYNSQTFAQAKTYMSEAARLNPALLANEAGLLAGLVAGWANYVKTSDPLAFLETVYEHLPDNLVVLRQRRRQELAKEAMQLGFAAYQQGDLTKARSVIWRAFCYQPYWLINRGALSIFIRSWLQAGKAAES